MTQETSATKSQPTIEELPDYVVFGIRLITENGDPVFQQALREEDCHPSAATNEDRYQIAFLEWCQGQKPLGEMAAEYLLTLVEFIVEEYQEAAINEESGMGSDLFEYAFIIHDWLSELLDLPPTYS